MFDTKKLHDWAVEAGLSFDKWRTGNVLTAWIAGALMDEELMAKHFAEWLVKGLDDEAAKKIAGDVAKYQDEADTIRKHASWASNSLIRAWGDAVNTRASFVGATAIQVVATYIGTELQPELDVLWEDVCNYHLDMEEKSSDH
jgi:hypothetical protein